MRKTSISDCLFVLALAIVTGPSLPAGDAFVDSVAPVLSRRCLSCHGENKAGGGLSLADPQQLIEAGYVEPGDAESSHLVELISPVDGHAEMPQDAAPLRAKEVSAIVRWIDAGANIPPNHRLHPPQVADLDWWSLRPIRSSITNLNTRSIDEAIDEALADRQLVPLPPADASTLIRRLSYDLTGLPPSPSQIDAFGQAHASNPDEAMEQWVDRLLDSPAFGEKWGQHWLDLARYAETHGYDKDQPRRHAWPYRDYVIASLNSDKPLSQFVQEQIAGDLLARDRSEGIVATGFLAAGPWDLIAHKEVGEGKLDGRIAKHLDRDEMATAVFNVFQSTTIQCAQCHHHKFDPIRSDDYYRVHACFAGIDRADRVYAGLSPDQANRKRDLDQQRRELSRRLDQANASFDKRVAEKASEIDPRIAELTERANRSPPPPQHGFHSTISQNEDGEKWVEVDLGESVRLRRIELIGCFDHFNDIGAGFGFPVRFKVEVCDDETFQQERAELLFDSTDRDFPNPHTDPVRIECRDRLVRHVRVTATRLAERRQDYIFALGELRAIEADSGKNLALQSAVSTSDHIPPNNRWAPQFLVDDQFHRPSISSSERAELARLREQRESIIDSLSTPEREETIRGLNERLAAIDQQLRDFPTGEWVYAAASDFPASGQFKPLRGSLRPIHQLHRGDLRAPGERVFPGAPTLWSNAPSVFFESETYDEAEARAALAKYVTHRDNPLLWRSMANRIWQWTFGKPIVATPNDFGRMGSKPTHPEILDALAEHLRDDPQQSIKSVIRMLVHTRAYRRSSLGDATLMRTNRSIDSGNDYLWKFNRRRLTAEEFRDTVLTTGGVLRLDDRGGPSFQDFVIKHPQHSPHYEYHLHDPDAPESHRRTIYRFVVRSQPQPMLTTLDCADPSISVARRDESTTALQALTQWNARLVEAMSRRFAQRIERTSDEDALTTACELAWGRPPLADERDALTELRQAHDMQSVCRVILNASPMMYID